MIGIGKSLFKSNVKAVSGAALDPSAQAFITAAGITDATQQSAVNQLVLDLKSALIWTKMSVIYPVLGGSASSHAVNLKSPGTYNMTFSLGWTHSSNGMTPNGTSAYADTGFASSFYSTSIHMSFYSRTQTVGGQYEMGANTGTTNTSLRPAVNTILGGTTATNFTTTTDARGFWIGSKRANNDREVYRNGVSQATNTTNVTTALPSINNWVGAGNNNGAVLFPSSKQCAFVSIGEGLTDTEASNFHTAINTYQTTLSRNV